MKTRGESKATTLPTSMGVLLPVASTDSSPVVAYAVPSQADTEQQKPRTGEKVAGAQDCGNCEHTHVKH